jgi:redox-sensitive bicupin YhaK (pirin superfamily)
MDVRRAADRYRVEQPGITTWHCFSAGAYYDPDNVAFGRLVACDEHLLAPGAGFAEHPHAGTELVSWVLDGTLAHSDSAGRRHLIQPGAVQYQAAGTGIRHAEYNASALEPLHFVQLALLADGEQAAYRIGEPPLTLRTARFDVLTRGRGSRIDGSLVHLFVGRGNFHVHGVDLAAGDSVRAVGPLEIDGDGQLLVVSVEA